MSFSPHVTVACIVEANQRFLLVEEFDRGTRVFNQPAGHLEAGESLIQAVTRELKEETGLELEPDGLVGTYLFTSPHNGITYLRFCFYCKLNQQPIGHRGDDPDGDIIACHWLTRQQIEKLDNLRSPLVLQCLQDYLRGQRAPLTLVQSDRDTSVQ
ncbi:NUDIX hydrolase [Dongshaea marina]|uniref:NUDIX hydrolase n=1 Tax=Dongshaea marina TaxID=2047966 RepID=UPI000D3E8C06|nr:NUDIX hydrolase [Dongshaea marina]